MATEVKQRNNRAFVILGVVLAIGAFALSLYLSQRNSGSGTGSGGSLINAVYTTQAVPKGTKITADMVVVKQVGSEAVPQGIAGNTVAVVNKFTTVELPAGSPVLPSTLAADQATSTTAALTTAPLDIHAGNVAIAIPVTGDAGRSAELVGVGNFIHDDDRIDIIIDDGKGTVRFGFQDVRVLHVGVSGAAVGAAPTVLVVELPRAQAEEVAWLVSKEGPNGVVRYALRAHSDYGKGPISAGTTDPNAAVSKPAPQDAPINQDEFNRLFPTK